MSVKQGVYKALIKGLGNKTIKFGETIEVKTEVKKPLERSIKTSRSGRVLLVSDWQENFMLLCCDLGQSRKGLTCYKFSNETSILLNLS